MFKAFLFITLAGFCISCSHDNKEAAEPKKAFDAKWAQAFIDSTNTKFSKDFAAKDSSALASCYWPDAELLLSNSEPIKGNQMPGAWGSVMRMGVKSLTFSTTDLKGDTEFIIETGAYEMKNDKDMVIDKGKYVVVWQQRNGVWKLYRDIGNTSLPAAK
jgi:ketosteroid isomerase-like protein